jgi:hypothetical protein
MLLFSKALFTEAELKGRCMEQCPFSLKSP